MSNTRAVEEMIPLLENVTDLEIAADYINVFSGIARSKIDGISFILFVININHWK